jgi:MoaA/NifB/PqqE/SkfB family radical SAM enzyme
MSPQGRGTTIGPPASIVWEVSRRCLLECGDCRATSLRPGAGPELRRDEGLALIAAARRAGVSTLVLTGPDPLDRPESHDWIREASAAGLTPVLAPSGTPFLPHGALRRAGAAGLAAVRVNVDGSRDAVHDLGPGARGSFRWSVEAAASTVALGLSLAVRTRLGRFNRDDLPRLLDLALGLEARQWRLVVPVDPASLPGPAPDLEALLLDLAAAAGRALRLRVEGLPSLGRRAPALPASPSLFVAADGTLLAEPFLPVAAGHLRQEPLDEVIRRSPLLETLRDRDRLGGRCGRCEHRAGCGGSRARAFRAAADWLAEDPACPHQPLGSQPAASGDGGQALA